MPLPWMSQQASVAFQNSSPAESLDPSGWTYRKPILSARVGARSSGQQRLRQSCMHAGASPAVSSHRCGDRRRSPRPFLCAAEVPLRACSAALLLPHAASPTVRIIPSRRAEILVSRVQGRLAIPSPPLRRRIFGMANVRMGSRRRYGPRQPADFKGRPSVRHRPRFRSVRSCSDVGPSPRRCGLVVRLGPHPGTPPPTDLAIRYVVQSGPAKLLRSCRPSRPAARGP
jgi:hypothetical protein